MIKKIKIKTEGFILWDMVVSIFIVILTSILIGTWYINLVSVNNYCVNKLKATNLACYYMEQFLSKNRRQSFKKDIFDLFWQKRVMSSDLSMHTINVLWLEKKQQCKVQLSTIASS